MTVADLFNFIQVDPATQTARFYPGGAPFFDLTNRTQYLQFNHYSNNYWYDITINSATIQQANGWYDLTTLSNSAAHYMMLLNALDIEIIGMFQKVTSMGTRPYVQFTIYYSAIARNPANKVITGNAFTCYVYLDTFEKLSYSILASTGAPNLSQRFITYTVNADAELTYPTTQDTLINILPTNTIVKLNGEDIETEEVYVKSGDTLTAVSEDVILSPTIGEYTEVLLNNIPLTNAAVTLIPGSANTLTTTNTKPEQPTPEITFTFDDGVQVQINEVNAVSGQAYPLTENASVIISSKVTPNATITVTYDNINTIKFDDADIVNNATLTVEPGTHTLNVVGATAIPEVLINGEGVNQFSVNGADFNSGDLPYTFTPQAGRTNSIYVTGTANPDKTITISGTHIASMTVNNVEVQLPYTVTITEPLDISVSGEIYQVDVSSLGGAIISLKDGTILSDGSKLHTILDIDKDTYLTIDGTHKLTVTGEDIKTITINGVAVDVSQLPVTINNNNMTATVVIGGYPPSEIHVTGMYIDSATLDGNAVQIGANGSVDLEVEVREENHFLTLAGSQPRAYNLTFNDNGTTNIAVNGQDMQNGQVLPITDSKYISSLPLPIPIHFDTDELTILRINGMPYYGDFTEDFTKESYIDVNSNSCLLTIDYGDNSYQLTVPRRMVTLTAPHRDGWIFDTWTSNDVGIINPRAVQCNIDLTNTFSAHIVANYQRYITCNKPNPWN